jgi:hypothetical protein
MCSSARGGGGRAGIERRRSLTVVIKPARKWTSTEFDDAIGEDIVGDTKVRLPLRASGPWR